MPNSRPAARSRHTRRQRLAWERLSDDQLLSLRFCDLHLTIEGTDLEMAIERLYRELATRGIRFRPHCWLAQEWVSPDGVPGIAIPFYLAHRRLVSIERRFVQHLGAWYAQAQPTEDFAETFAVWLKPNSPWRREYLGWPAFAKLEYIDGLAAEIGDVKPPVADRTCIEDVADEVRTLRQHYEDKLARYRIPRRSGADELLLKVFTTAPRRRSAPKAASVLRELRNPLRQQIVRSGAFSEYLVHQVLRLMVDRCESLDLR